MMLNNTIIPSFPIKITVIATDPERLKSGLDISYIQDDFALENLEMKVSEVKEEVFIPSYTKTIHFNELESNE